MQSWLVYPSLLTGKNRQIELAGSDLRFAPCINNVFVYSSSLNINRLKDALSSCLSSWPLVAGHCLLMNTEHYFIVMSDHGIPVTFIQNTQLNKWSLDSNVVRDSRHNELSTFFDLVTSTKEIFNCPNEPLFRLKITHIVQSNEWIMGTSWSHLLGDAYVCAKFLHGLSRAYQQLEPLKPLPIFERRLWYENTMDESLLPTMKHLTNTLTVNESMTIDMFEQFNYDQLNLHISGKQLDSLRRLIPSRTLTIHDLLIAYIISTLNIHCISNKDELILQTSIVINYHGVSDAITPSNLVANGHLRIWSDNFEDPYSLLVIAKSIRRLINQSRDADYLERWITTAEILYKTMAHDDRRSNADHFRNGIIINSNFRYDWANLVDFGQTDQCRFYTDWTRKLFLRVFHLNPIYDDFKWKERDCRGAEIAFRCEENMKKKFIEIWQRDLDENFINVNVCSFST